MTDPVNGGRRLPQTVAIILLLTLCVACFASCTYGGGSTTTAKKMDFLSLELTELEKYLYIDEYKGLQITLGQRTKGEAVWQTLSERAEVKSYPEQHVYYYVEQLRAQYEYYAERAGISYEEILEQLGINEGDILREAKELTKGDILFAIVVKKEGITLSDTEKQTLFDKYVEKYVSEYGYTESYVKENMTDRIYDSMLYDKVTEFLIINNTVINENVK